jgi:protein TonB
MVQREKERKPTTPEKKPDPEKLTQPDERPKETELQPEDKMPETEQKGVADGSDLGSEEGMEGGIEGGEVGGVPGGVLGGVLGGTGVATDWDQPPRILRQQKPVYPPEAFTKKIEGVVEVEFVVELNGRVEHARAVSGPAILRAAAVQAVSQWVFVPGVRGGQPVRTRHVAPVRFRIY